MTGEQHAASYWYVVDSDTDTTTDQGVRVLAAMRNYRSSEVAMRKRSRGSMRMGETDLTAIRLILAAQRSGRAVSPKDLAFGLGISSASTTVLLDRLEKSGHVTRHPHPRDRRGVVVEATDAANVEVRHTLGAMHDRMMAVAASLSPENARAVIDFLQGMRLAVDEQL